MHVPKAFIVLKKGVEEDQKIIDELKALCKEKLSVYSQPKEFEFRKSLPRTLYNKIDYKSLEIENQESKLQK